MPALTISTDSSSSVIQSVSSSEETTTEALQEESSQAESSEASDSSTTTSEAETETSDSVAAGSLSAETSDVTVTVTYEDDTFSEPVTLKVSSVSDTSAINDKLTSVLSETKQTLAQAYTYDISFVTASGEEVEPSKDVNVSIAFKNAVSSSELGGNWKLYHFVDNDVNKVEDLTGQTDTTINQDSSENVTSVDFKSDSFSNYTVADVTYADFSDYLTGYSYDESSVQEDLSTEELTISLKLSFKINQTDLTSEKIIISHCQMIPQLVPTLQSEQNTLVVMVMVRKLININFTMMSQLVNIISWFRLTILTCHQWEVGLSLQGILIMKQSLV